MKINFYEEFPTKENLSKLKLVEFPTKLFVAAGSISELKNLNLNNVEVIYWPVLNKKDGYWLSPWSDPKALDQCLEDVARNNIKMLWDAEFPIRRTDIIKRIPYFLRNRKKIISFFKQHGSKIYTAEYSASGFLRFLLSPLALGFDPGKYNNKITRMFYTSVRKYPGIFLRREIRKSLDKYGDNFIPALGVIAAGIKGDEPILTPKNLERDLKLCQEAKVKEVVIFRLGGLNKEYVKVIKKFLS